MKVRLKYVKPKYALFFLKLVYLKIKFGKALVTSGGYYGFEKDVAFRIEEGGTVRLGRVVYFSKRTDIMAIGGYLEIGNHVSFNKDCTVVSRSSIRIGDYCRFGESVSIYDHNHNMQVDHLPFCEQGFSSRPVVIGNNVWVGGKVFIKSGVTIGDNVIIGANSVVTKDIPSGTKAFGNPAMVRFRRDIQPAS